MTNLYFNLFSEPKEELLEKENQLYLYNIFVFFIFHIFFVYNNIYTKYIHFSLKLKIYPCNLDKEVFSKIYIYFPYYIHKKKYSNLFKI